MKSFIAIFLIFFTLQKSLAQNSPEEIFKNLLDEDRSSEILKIHKEYEDDDLTAQALYYIGIAYFYSGSNNPAINYFSKAISKGPTTAKMYYFNSLANKESGYLEASLLNIEKAVELDAETAYYLTENAEILMELERKEDARLLFDKAYSMGDRSGKVIYYLSQFLYNDNKNNKEALLLLEKGANELDTDDEFYPVVLYNISVIEFINGNHRNSNEVLFQFMRVRPDNYFVVPVIIQNYFAMENYDSAKHFIDLMYYAHENNNLSEDMKDDFCFDRFKWKEFNVYGYESFEKLDTSGDYQRLHKHIFFFYDKTGKVSFTIQTERFNDFGMGNLNFDYVMGLGEYSNDQYFHKTFGTLNLKDPVDYKLLKEYVFKILNKEVKPTSSSKSKDKK